MNRAEQLDFPGRARRMWDRVISRAGGSEAAVRWARSFGAMLLLSRARVGPGVAPFAAAYFAASLDTGPGLSALLAGCLMGALITGLGPESLFTPAGCAVSLALWLFRDKTGRDRRGRDSIFVPMSAAMAVLLPALAAAGYDPKAWLFAVIAAIFAAVMAMENWMRLSKGVTVPGLAIWTSAAVILLGNLGLNPAYPAAFFAALASCGGKGAACGMFLGAVSLLSGGNILSIAVSGVCGAAGDMARALRPSPIFPGIAAALAAGAVSLWQGAGVWVVIPCILTASLPRKIREPILAVISPDRIGGEQLVAAYRLRTQTQLRALGEAFGELSSACGADDPAFGEQQLITSMRSALCTGCAEYSKCWPGRDSRAVKLFCQLMTAAIERGASPFENGEAPPEIMRLCRRGMLVPSRLGGMLSDFAAQRHRRVRLMGARRLIAAEFSQAAEIINAMMQEQSRPVSVREGAAARAKAALSAEGLAVTDVAALFRDRLEVTVEAAEPWSPARLQRAQAAVSRALGRPFAPSGTDHCRAGFISGCTLKISQSVSALPADADMPSGDSSMIRDLGGGKILVALSDGMGSGEAAAGESRRVLRLICALLRSGVPRETALSAVNGVMLARGGEEMFATVDMLTIDLCTGMGNFAKLSACRSYILRAGKIIPVEGGRLPLGILEQVQPACRSVKLKSGDTVVMLTDGVADAMPEDVLTGLIKSSAKFSPAAMSEAIINAAAARAPRRRDDMTALCLKLAT